MEVFNLNIIPGAVAPIIHASQYDEDREFRANLFEGDQVFELTGAETISVNVRKPDGNVVTAAVVNTGSNYVEFSTTLQMTACAGANLCQLRIEDSPRKIGTLNFILAVERDPLEGGIQSESAIHDLQAQIAAAVAEQYDAADVIFDAAPTPGHGVGYAVTSEGVAAAIPQDLDDLNDVTTSAPTTGEAFIYDGAKWTNGTPALDVGDLDDVTITTPSNGEILVYNNGSWENQANPASTANFAPDYDDTATYNTNDKVIYQGLMYVCLEDNITGAWDNTKWQNISVADYTAELLPIESGSATNTKAYIDSGLSGKADKTSTQGTLSSPVGTLARGSLRKIGDIKYVSFGILLSSGISTSTKILSLPSGFNATVNLDGTGLTRTSGVDTVCDFYITGNEIQYNSSGSVASGSYVFGSFWYI